MRSFFQQFALLLIGSWLVLVAIWFRRSTPVLLGGLIIVPALTLAALLANQVSLTELGLDPNALTLSTPALAVAWLALMLAASPVADWIASRLIATPPTLAAFRVIQQSRMHLAAGILFAWVFGAVLEELVFRGIVLSSVEVLAGPFLGMPTEALAIVVAALGAGIIHLYQGPRAALVITQLSILFGTLFVVSLHNLWAVMLCHGLYDTVAFMRFARGKSKYSKLDPQPEP